MTQFLQERHISCSSTQTCSSRSDVLFIQLGPTASLLCYLHVPPLPLIDVLSPSDAHVFRTFSPNRLLFVTFTFHSLHLLISMVFFDRLYTEDGELCGATFRFRETLLTFCTTAVCRHSPHPPLATVRQHKIRHAVDKFRRYVSTVQMTTTTTQLLR